MNRLLALAALVLAAGAAGAEDWPRWRGPRGDGTWDAPKLPKTWPAELTPVWRQPVGGGFSGVIVADGRVVVQDYEPGADPKGPGTERVWAFDAATGKPQWAHSYPATYTWGFKRVGPRATPAVAGGKVYALGGVGHLHCLDAATGTVLWSKHAAADLGGPKGGGPWGYAASPVVDGDRVIVTVGAEAGGCCVALDRHTGKEVWRSPGTDPLGCSTPVLVPVPGGRVLVCWTPANLRGIDPDTGKDLWVVPRGFESYTNVSTLLADGDAVLGVAENGTGVAVRVGPKPADVAVVTPAGKLPNVKRHNQGLARGGHAYLPDAVGVACVELKTGKTPWAEEGRLHPKPPGFFPGTLVWAGGKDRAVFLNNAGELYQLRLDPAGCEVLTKTQALPGAAWSHPAFVGKYLFAKTDGGNEADKGGPFELVCVDLAAGK